jgi:phospholipid/cholesterol/gamma-HCH transport system ATP-binding protein
MTDNWVTIRNLCFQRGERIIFDDVDLDIRRGKITAILGPSGTGKTTLLRLIGAQLIPSAGTVEVNGVNVHQLSREELYVARRQMGMLFQSGALFTNLTAFENVAFPLREHTNLPESVLRDLVLMKLQAVGLRGARDLSTSQLSGGMARRVALARAIALDPQLIMYDEPFTGLDPVALGIIVQLIKRLNEALGMTSVLVSHDVAETTSIADYIYMIADGKVIGQGTPKELLRDKTPKVQQFMQGLPDGPVPFHYPAKDYAEDLDL